MLKIPTIQKIVVDQGETFTVPAEIDGVKVWVFDTQTKRLLRPGTVIRAEQKTVIKVVPAVAGG